MKAWMRVSLTLLAAASNAHAVGTTIYGVGPKDEEFTLPNRLCAAQGTRVQFKADYTDFSGRRWHLPASNFSWRIRKQDGSYQFWNAALKEGYGPFQHGAGRDTISFTAPWDGGLFSYIDVVGNAGSMASGALTTLMLVDPFIAEPGQCDFGKESIYAGCVKTHSAVPNDPRMPDPALYCIPPKETAHYCSFYPNFCVVGDKCLADLPWGATGRYESPFGQRPFFRVTQCRYTPKP